MCTPAGAVGLILVPTAPEGLARAVGEAHRRYTRRVNFREGWRGYLWQGRFSSFVMDEDYALSAARYVERNPVKARLVRRADPWPWSSAAAHVAGRGDAVCEGGWLAEPIAGWVCTWRQYLGQADEQAFASAMRTRENTGRPFGEKAFVQQIGALLGRDLLPKKPDRKRKEEK